MHGRLRWRGRTSAATRRVSEIAVVVAAGLAAAAMLPAAAAASSPIALDAADNGNAPLVAYAPQDGYSYVAWSAPDNQNDGNGVDLCVLAPNATTCAGGSPVLLTDTNTAALGTNSDNTVGLGGLVILPGSGEVVVLGTPVETGTVAWASPPGGAAFLAAGGGLQNGGNFISPVSIFYTTNNAAAISSTDVAIFDSYDHFNSYFSDSPFAGPQTPSTLAQDPCPTDPGAGAEGNANNCGQFDDQGDTQGPVIAAEPAPPPAAAGTYVVVGAGANVSSNETTPPGCVNDAATGYGVDVGTTGASGTLDSQGLQPNGFGLLACAAEDPTLASGGKDGIGVLEVEGSGVSGAGSAYELDFRPFAATATGGTFSSTPAPIAQLSSTPDDVDVAEDSSTGVYALWSEGGLHVAYSPNGGVSWDAPVLVPEPANGAIGDPTIAGVANGVVDLAFSNNPGTGTQTFLQPVEAIPPTTTTLPSSATSNGSTVTFTISCSAACTITVTVEVPSGSTGHASIARKKTSKVVTLASGRFKLGKKGSKKLSLKFTRSGKALFKKDHSKLKATLLVSDKTAQGTIKSSKTLRITKSKKK